MIAKLPALARSFQGILPGALATCAPDGTPNVTYLSQIRQVDERHVAISRQFFNKTSRNLEANPRATAAVVDPVTFESWKLGLRYVRSETDTPLFVEMALRVEAIASFVLEAALDQALPEKVRPARRCAGASMPRRRRRCWAGSPMAARR